MLKIKNTLSFAALLCGIIVCFAHSNAAAQFVPPGSYQKSCSDIKTVGAMLSAGCSAKDKGKFTGTATLNDYFECDGDIWNDDGKLKCNRNANSALMQKAKKAIDVSFKYVTGAKIDNDLSYKFYVGLMFEDGLAAKFYSGNYGMLDSGLIDFFRNWLSNPKNTLKPQIIETAFKDVYSYGASPKDFAFYNAQKIGYQDIVNAERKKLVADKIIHRLMILAAYKKTFGRAPNVAEYNYWTAKNEIYKELVEVNRAFLYAPNGAKDLTETVKRALADRGNDKPTIAQINQALAAYAQKKAIYSEM